MFRKTVDSVLSDIQGKIEDLHTLAEKHQTRAEYHETQALNHLGNGNKAKRIAEKFANLIN